MARPAFEPTADQRKNVETFAGVGLSHDQMALLITHPDGEAISVDTLTRHFADELTRGKARIIGRMAGEVVRIALGQDPNIQGKDRLPALFFFLKTKGGWRETDNLHHSFDEADKDSSDDTAVAARIAGLLEKGRRRQKSPTVQ